MRGPADPREYRYTRDCLSQTGLPVTRWCDSDRTLRDPVPDCEQGMPVPPRWSRLRGADDDAWLLDTLHSCPGDSNYPISFEDFAVLPIDPSPARIQPDQSWVYAGLDTIALTSDEPQGFVVELRGQIYHVGAIPQEFTWDFGDGTPPVTTADPGQPWPDHTVSHTYSAAGTATPTLSSCASTRRVPASSTLPRPEPGQRTGQSPRNHVSMSINQWLRNVSPRSIPAARPATKSVVLAHAGSETGEVKVPTFWAIHSI